MWTEDDERFKRLEVPVTVGLDDGSFAEIRSGDLRPGDGVVVAQTGAGKSGKPKAAAAPSFRA